MVARLSAATNGQNAITSDAAMLRTALTAAGAPHLESEISKEGRGASIFHTLSTEGSVPLRDLASWVCVEKKCSSVSGFRRGDTISNSRSYYSNITVILFTIYHSRRGQQYFVFAFCGLVSVVYRM